MTEGERGVRGRGLRGGSEAAGMSRETPGCHVVGLGVGMSALTQPVAWRVQSRGPALQQGEGAASPACLPALLPLGQWVGDATG